jgi:hypothetical protein
VSSSTFTPAGGLATNNLGNFTGSNAITDANDCLPYLICAYNSYLEIGGGRVVNLIP